MPNSRAGSPWIKIALALAAAGFAACGNKEASQMEKFADQVCACTTVDCADKLFPEIEKFTTENAGKEVEASAADKYAKAMDRTTKCLEKLHEDADKKTEKK